LEALQQNGSGGRLTVRARQLDGAVVELTVEDNGPGIADDVRPRLFSPFASGRESTGLGLAIARALARASGGELTCVDARAGHTCFRFTFQGPARLSSDQRRLPQAQTTERMDASLPPKPPPGHPAPGCSYSSRPRPTRAPSWPGASSRWAA